MRRIHHTLLTALTALLFLATGSGADTTNRALQVSPVPGVFVGGVGLLCASGDTSAGTAFFLLTRDRETAGSALFDNDDVTYAMMSLTVCLQIWQGVRHYRGGSQNAGDIYVRHNL